MAMETREIGNLIGSDKVEGTAVYGADSEKIGTIERVMIDKVSGKVSYAVLGFGGFLGIGHDHYPLPWQSLKYDTRLGGYVTGVTEKPAAERTEIRQRQRLELGRPCAQPRGERLLRRADGMRRAGTIAVHRSGFFDLEDDMARKAKKRKYSEGAAKKVEPRDEEAQGRHAAQRPLRQEGEESQAGDRDRSVRGAQERRPGAEAEKEILRRPP